MLCRVEQNKRLCWGNCCDLPERVQELLRWWNYEDVFRNVLMVFQVVHYVRGPFFDDIFEVVGASNAELLRRVINTVIED